MYRKTKTSYNFEINATFKLLHKRTYLPPPPAMAPCACKIHPRRATWRPTRAKSGSSPRNSCRARLPQSYYHLAEPSIGQCLSGRSPILLILLSSKNSSQLPRNLPNPTCTAATAVARNSVSSRCGSADPASRHPGPRRDSAWGTSSEDEAAAAVAVHDHELAIHDPRSPHRTTTARPRQRCPGRPRRGPRRWRRRLRSLDLVVYYESYHTILKFRLVKLTFTW